MGVLWSWCLLVLLASSSLALQPLQTLRNHLPFASFGPTTKRSDDSTLSRPGPLGYRHHPDDGEKDDTMTVIREPTSSSPMPRFESSLNVPLLAKIGYTQLSLLWTGTLLSLLAMIVLWIMNGDVPEGLSSSWASSMTTAKPSWEHTLWPSAIAAALPMIALQSWVESSHHGDASHFQFSNAHVVMNLFGRRPRQPPPETMPQRRLHYPTSTAPAVLAAATLLALVTATSEEIVFRGYLPFVLSQMGVSLGVGLVVQGLVFGALHQTPKSTTGENRLRVALYTLVGWWLGGVVYGSGDMGTCIAAHFVLDLHHLVSTWHQVNCQMDWTEDHQFVDDSPMWQVCRRFFYAFDSERCGSLSLGDVQRALAYAMPSSWSAQRPQVELAFEGKERLELPQFVQLLFQLQSNPATNDSS